MKDTFRVYETTNPGRTSIGMTSRLGGNATKNSTKNTRNYGMEPHRNISGCEVQNIIKDTVELLFSDKAYEMDSFRRIAQSACEYIKEEGRSKIVWLLVIQDTLSGETLSGVSDENFARRIMFRRGAYI